MRVLVTGAGGAIGRPVVRELLDKGFDVTAVDRNVDSVDSRAKRHQADIFDSSLDLFSSFNRPELVIHLAWQDGFVHDSPRHMEELSNHVHFIRRIVAAGCKHVATMGSVHEVGYHLGVVTENTPCNPQSQYGVAKNALRGSLLLAAEKEAFTLQWLRGFYIVNADPRGNSIFSKIAQAAATGQGSFPFTSGTNEYDFLTIGELTHQVVAAATQDETTGIINVCSGRPESLASRVERFIAENGFEIELEYGAFPDRPYDSPQTFGDPTKINQILGG